jgi:hypothetical protein
VLHLGWDAVVSGGVTLLVYVYIYPEIPMEGSKLDQFGTYANDVG